MSCSSSNDGTSGLPTKSRMLIKKRAAPKIFDKRPNPISTPKLPVDAPKTSNESSRTDEDDNTENTTKQHGESCRTREHNSELESLAAQPVLGCPVEENVSKSCVLSQSTDLIESASFERVFDQSLEEVHNNCESHSTTNIPDESESNLHCNNVAFVQESPLKSIEPSSSTNASGVHDEIVEASEKAVQNDYHQENVIILQIDGKECERVFAEAVDTCQDVITEGTVLLELVDESGVPPEDVSCNDSKDTSEVPVDDHALSRSGHENEGNQVINTEIGQEMVVEKEYDCRDEITKIKTNALPPKKRVIRDIVARTCKRRPEDSILLKENEKMEKAFKHCALRKQRKKKKVKVDKTVNIRKKNNPKKNKQMLVSEQNKDKLSLRDYIFYVPDSEPMKEEIIKPEVAPGMPEEQEEENIDEPEEMDHGPKLIIKDGEIIVDPQSTMIKRSVPQVYKDIKVERFKQRREAFETWSLKDTVRFYYTLWQYGIDFSLISSSFSSKSRHAVKNKFNLERRNNSCIVSKILAKKSDDDEDSFKSIMKELIIRCSKLAKKKKVKETVPSVTTSHHFDKKSKKKTKTKRKTNPTDVSSDEKNNLFRKLFNCDSNNENDDDTLIGSDFDESDVNNLVNITFSTNVVYQDMNIVESVSFDPTASNPVDVNVTISHEDKGVTPTEGKQDVINC